MSIWTPKDAARLRLMRDEDGNETRITLAEAMEKVVAGVLFWCDHCQVYHVALALPKGEMDRLSTRVH